MSEEVHKTERQREVQVIKKILGPDQGGRGAYMPGLWACRLAAGLTQRELAEKAGTGAVTIRQLERRERCAHATTLRRLSEALEVSPADLLTAESMEAAEEEE
jgi:ribosome-binding protein aMBF1 (putative translation factor)